MTDEPKDAMKVDRYKSSELGLDKDVWQEKYRRSVRSYGNPAQSLEFYFRLFVESPIAMIVTTSQFTVADANNAAQRLFRIPLDRFRGRAFSLHVAQSDRNASGDILREVEEGSSPISRPLLIKVGNNELAEVVLTACMIRNEAGEPEFAVFVFLERGENVSSDML